MLNSFDHQLATSKGKRSDTDVSTLKEHITGCIEVNQTEDLRLDKKGVDFVATLRGGAELLIDLKSREKGASRFWRYGEPELALEIYSVKERKTVGWTLDESKITDYIYYTFEDVSQFYLIPFQTLRIAFINNFYLWRDTYSVKYQKSQSYGKQWTSSAIFVPASVILEAVKLSMIGMT